MKKLFILFFALITANSVFSQGGMWLPALIGNQIKNMQATGFKLSAEDVYSVNKACMKDAVLLFGGGCTGEIVSDKGLLLTNHHCGRGEIVSHSTLEHDYLTDGFWAKSMAEELPCKGLNVKILDRMIELPSDEEERNKAVEEYEKKLEGVFEFTVEKFYAGNLWYMFVYKSFNDVRLVGAPPSAIGSFGGDTDNWMWPRHGGDFSVFRIYADKNNNPTTDYSADNVPYKPKYHFKISLKGVEKDNFTMVFGFPGTTEEYLPKVAVKAYKDKNYPARIFCRQTRMSIMEEAMNADRQTRLNYTSIYNGAENAKKKWEGTILGLNRFDVVSKKEEQEKTLSKNSEIKNLLSEYEKLYAEKHKFMMADAYFYESVYQTSQFKLGEKAFPLTRLEIENSPQTIVNQAQEIYEKTLSVFASRDSAVERKIFASLYKIYSDSCKDFMPEALKEIISANNLKTSDDFVNYYYQNSVLSDSTRLKNIILKYVYLDKNQKKFEKNITDFVEIIKNDIGIKYYFELIRLYFQEIMPGVTDFENKAESLDKQYQALLMKVSPETIKFPDANSTLRFTFGKVDGYIPRDAVVYNYYTTLDGVIEKDNPQIYDYNVPEKLKTLYQSKDYGRYADKDGKIHVCFLASNHTTGGNSGSPVLNANGELIGINFDRCWEGTMSDIYYNPEICRNISVDIRYVLFLIEKLGGAENLIKEMDIAK
ncbi:MAG: S46 family peptidase [Bacteroidales bacterium]|nr:S46 family peptidase [Bacteroidales bacterium]